MTKRKLAAGTITIVALALLFFGPGMWHPGEDRLQTGAFDSLGLNGPPAAVAAPRSSTVMVPVSFTDLAEKARAGVVNIRTVKNTKEGGPVFRHFFRSEPFPP